MPTSISIRPGKGQKFPACICEYNIDITAGGCAIALNSKTNIYDKDTTCSYCYAGYLHRRYICPKIVRETAWTNTINSMRINVIRIGKNSEPGAIAHRAILKEVLELNNKYNCKSILITKLLEYDQEIADLLRVHDSTVHFSLGNPDQEKGALLFYASTNLTRMKFADQYRQANVNTWARPTEDIALPMPLYISEAVQRFPKVQILITPLRYRKKQLFPFDWDTVRADLDPRYYYDVEEKAIAPKAVHPDWKPYISNGCGKIKNKMMCNLCGLKNAQINNKHKQQFYEIIQ